MKHSHPSRVPRVLVAALAAGLIAAANWSAAAPKYEITNVYVPPDQYAQGGKERDLEARPIYKPHDSRTTYLPNFWITSNERTGCAGITTLSNRGDRTLKNVIIDEPGVAYNSEEAGLTPCVGSIEPPPAVEPPEGTPPGPEDQFPADARFNPTVCLPVVLPPGQTSVPYDVENPDGSRSTGNVKSPGPGLVCAPLGAEQHPRHPHGITVDFNRQRAYQVIEHAGLRWNADRTAFQIANTTDEESGLTLAWDIKDPRNPKYLKAYLNGHGAHEITVNQVNGLVFQGNHEDSHGVSPSIWVDVIDTTKANPYGFIDTGYFHAVQGIDVDEGKNLVYGTDHVGELVFAFDASCKPQPNPAGVVPPPAPPGYSLPAGDTNMKMGWNCIKWWVNVRPAFLAAFPELAGVMDPTAALANVLHMHNGAADGTNHRSYSVIHAIHDAEHTGLAANEPPPGTETEEGETAEHFMGRYVVEVGQPSSVNRNTKQATAPVYMIDLSHGFDILAYPNVDSITGGLNRLEKSFVHAHFIWVDPDRNALLVTGEHTGNLGVVDTQTRKLEQVIGITRAIKGCTPPPPEPGTAPEAEEPHVHGVTVQPITGTVYVTDEGEHCFYESATVLNPIDQHNGN
jgi:hypothetical protein